MPRTSDRPLAITLVAVWAAIEGVRALASALILLLVGLALPWALVLGVLFALASVAVALGLFAVAGGLYRLRGWARLGGLLLFGAMALLNLVTLAAKGPGVNTVASIALDGAAFLVLLNEDRAFRPGRYRP